MGQIKELANEIHENAVVKGFYPENVKASDPIWISSRLMLVVSELAEGLEMIRSPRAYNYRGGLTKDAISYIPKSGGLGEELADAVIRIFDLAESLEIDIEGAIVGKHEFNKGREYKHGGKTL